MHCGRSEGRDGVAWRATAQGAREVTWRDAGRGYWKISGCGEASGLEDDVDEDADSDFDGRSISHPSPSVEVQLDPTAGQARLFAWGSVRSLVRSGALEA